MAQVGVHGLRARDAQQRAPQRHPAAVAVADEEQEQVVRRQRPEDACAQGLAISGYWSIVDPPPIPNLPAHGIFLVV